MGPAPPLAGRGRLDAVGAGMAVWLVIPWLDDRLRQAGRPDLTQWDLRPGVAAVTAATVGAVLASRRPGHPVGWLLLAFGLVPQALSGAAEGYARYGLLARPGTLPGAEQLATLPRPPLFPA